MKERFFSNLQKGREEWDEEGRKGKAKVKK